MKFKFGKFQNDSQMEMTIKGTIDEFKNMIASPQLIFNKELEETIASAKLNEDKFKKHFLNKPFFTDDEYTFIPPREAHKQGKKSLISIDREGTPANKEDAECFYKTLFDGTYLENIIDEGLNTLRDIFESGAPENEWAFLQEETLDNIFKSSNIKEYAKLAASRYKKGEAAKLIFESMKEDSFDECNLMFISSIVTFCMEWKETAIIATFEQHTKKNIEYLENNKNRGVSSGLKRLEKTAEQRKLYLQLCRNNPSASIRKINDDFYDKTGNRKPTITSKTLRNWRKQAGL